MKYILLVILIAASNVCFGQTYRWTPVFDSSQHNIGKPLGDTLHLPLTTKYRFIKIGDTVFEIKIKPEIKVAEPLNPVYYWQGESLIDTSTIRLTF